MDLSRILKDVGNRGNCITLALEMTAELQKKGLKPRTRQVIHKSDPFGDLPMFCCRHVCGESYTQHFVVEVNNTILDPKLGYPVPKEYYLEAAYCNHEELRMI